MTNREKFKALQELEKMKFAYHQGQLKEVFSFSDKIDKKITGIENIIAIATTLFKLYRSMKK